MNKGRRHKKPVRRLNTMVFKRAAQMACVLLCFFILGYGAFWLRDPEHFPITSVNLVGDREHVQLSEMKSLILPQAELGFFRLEISTLQQALLTIPWMQDVAVRRQWPDRLVIRYRENVPQVRWDDVGLISSEGQLFYPENGTKDFSNLPLLKGPPDKAWQVWQMYLVMNQVLARQDLSISTLVLSPRGAWQLRLSNGTKVVLGTDHALDKLNQFLLCYEDTLKTQIDNIAYVDLRYTSGMALGWKHH